MSEWHQSTMEYPSGFWHFYGFFIRCDKMNIAVSDELNSLPLRFVRSSHKPFWPSCPSVMIFPAAEHKDPHINCSSICGYRFTLRPVITSFSVLGYYEIVDAVKNAISNLCKCLANVLLVGFGHQYSFWEIL